MHKKENLLASDADSLRRRISAFENLYSKIEEAEKFRHEAGYTLREMLPYVGCGSSQYCRALKVMRSDNKPLINRTVSGELTISAAVAYLAAEKPLPEAPAELSGAKEVYTAKHNTLLDTGKHYRLTVRGSKNYFTLSRTTAMKGMIIRLLQSGRRLRYDRYIYCGDERQGLLAEYVLCALYDVVPSDLQHGCIVFRDGDRWNLTTENLAHGGIAVGDNGNRIVMRTHDRLFVMPASEPGGDKLVLPVVTDFRQNLFDALLLPDCWNWQYLCRDNRMASDFKINGEAKARNIYFYHLAWAAAYYGIRDKKPDVFSVTNALTALKEGMQNKSLILDHLDASVQHNYLSNLALMTDAQNKRKGNLQRQIIAPYFWYSVRDSIESETNHFRIVCGHYIGRPTQRLFQCEGVEVYLALLDCFVKGKVFSDVDAPGAYYNAYKPTEGSISTDVSDVCGGEYDKIREELLKMEEAAFENYDSIY